MLKNQLDIKLKLLSNFPSPLSFSFFFSQKTLASIIYFGATINLIMINDKPLYFAFFVFGSLYYSVIQSIYWIWSIHILGFKISHGERLEPCYQFNSKKVYGVIRLSVQLIQSIILNLYICQSHTKFKDSLKKYCIKQRCDRGKTLMLDFFYNNRDFFCIKFFFSYKKNLKLLSKLRKPNLAATLMAQPLLSL